MTTANLRAFLHRLTRGAFTGTLAEQSDRQLVEQLLAGPGEAAFEAILRRHGPMVYRVCWRVLHQEQDVEDAFQATFLILVQQSRAVHKRDSLASWLHGVAHRVALRARAAAAKRCRHEHEASVGDGMSADDLSWREVRAVLDSELAELPEKWRLPLILCYLEGLTQDEAAGQIGWSKRTLRRRLEEARVALGRRLARRGIVWPAALAPVLLSDCAATTALRQGIIRSTVQAGAALAAGKPAAGGLISANVAALMQGVAKAASASKLQVATIVLVLTAVAGVGFIKAATVLLGDRGPRQSVPAGKAATGHPTLEASRKAAKRDPEVPQGARRPVKTNEGEAFGELHCIKGHAPHWVINVALAPNGRRALSASFDRTVRLWDLEKGKELHRFEGHTGRVLGVAFSPDGRKALSGGEDKTLRLWDVESGKQLCCLEGHASQVRCVQFLSDGRRALSSSSDTTIRLWDIKGGKELRRFEGHVSEPMTVVVSPDEKRILSGSFDGTMRLWDVKTGNELRRFAWQGGRVYAVAFSPDSRRALSGSDDRIVRLWDLEKGKELRRFEGHTDGVFGVAFSRDGRRVLSSSQDRTVRLWDVKTGRQIGQFAGHGGGVFSVTFSRDGRWALSGGKDGTVRYWRLPP
jgi:RNA polymerase sigma factor (sigma-70 family)